MNNLNRALLTKLYLFAIIGKLYICLRCNILLFTRCIGGIRNIKFSYVIQTKHKYLHSNMEQIVIGR